MVPYELHHLATISGRFNGPNGAFLGVLLCSQRQLGLPTDTPTSRQDLMSVEWHITVDAAP